MTDLTYASATQLAKLIRDRTLSSLEIVDIYLAKIVKHNPKLNAICTLDAENAREQAKKADEATVEGESWGPLHGVPITVKDIFETQYLKTTAGYKPLRDYIPEQDATVVARLRAAGAVVLGKTNLAELAGDFQSTNSLFLRVNNPWNTDYTPGGSSGGSAAAVAAGLTALDLGNDIAGSIRQPAHFCGVYGLKPTDGRLSTAGTIPEVPGMPHCLRQMMTVGCFTRSLEDIQLCFPLMLGPDPRRPEVPPVPLDTPSGRPLSELKIALIDEWSDVPVAEDIRVVMADVVKKLAEKEVQIGWWQPEGFNLSAILTLYAKLAAYTNIYAQPKDWPNAKRGLTQIYRTATQGDRTLRRLGDFSRVLPELLNPSLKGYFETLTERDLITAQIDKALEPWDVWLTPVAATAAFTHRPAWSAVDIDGRAYPHAVANGAYTMPFNLSGHPAVVIPVGKTPEGLPVGLQIVGKRWQEMELLAIAQQIDDIVGGFTPPPDFINPRNNKTP